MGLVLVIKDLDALRLDFRREEGCQGALALDGGFDFSFDREHHIGCSGMMHGDASGGASDTMLKFKRNIRKTK
jgi:hypothetical protein